MQLIGSGFIVTPTEAKHLGLGKRDGLENHIREYRNGRDLTGTPRGVMVIDLFGLEANEVRERFPEVYQHVLQTVKPERDNNNRDSYKRLWWVFGEPRKDLRPALLNQPRYIATVETAKHRLFTFVGTETLPDNKLIVLAFADPWHLAILHSSIHFLWYVANSAKIGMYEGDAVYVKSRCFDPFPFPSATDAQREKIARIAEALDKHRKDAQATHPDITLTEMYNVLEKVKAGAALDADDIKVRDNALILILRELHDELDAAVAEAYGWPIDLPEGEVLARLVALNKERAAEEAKGLVRWLRPEYQIPRFGSAAEKAQLEADFGDEDKKPPKAEKLAKIVFPNDAVGQAAAIMAALAKSGEMLTATTLASQFKQGKKVEKRVAATLASLARTGFIAASEKGTAFALRRAK